MRSTGVGSTRTPWLAKTPKAEACSSAEVSCVPRARTPYCFALRSMPLMPNRRAISAVGMTPTSEISLAKTVLIDLCMAVRSSTLPYPEWP